MLWFLLILVVIAILAVISYNNLIRLRTSVDEAWFSMDVFLKKRYDLIPNLVETVKGYALHESTVLERLVNARQTAVSAKSHEAVFEGNRAVTGGIRDLLAVAEAYPDLKADGRFGALQQALSEVEGEIANARLYYNGICRKFNEGIRMFPAVLLASALRYSESPYWNAEENERGPVEVKF